MDNFDFKKYLAEGKLLREEGKTSIYIVVEDGDNNQYVLDDMKVFSNEKDADEYAASDKYGTLTVIRGKVQ